MRKYGKIDANQKQIVSNLRRLGYSVYSTASLGDGFPDIIVGIKNQNFLFEIKDGTQVKSKQKLTELEQKFFDSWKGQVSKIGSLEEILEVIENLRK